MYEYQSHDHMLFVKQKKNQISVTKFLVDGILSSSNIWTAASTNLPLNMTNIPLPSKKCKKGSVLMWNSKKVSSQSPYGSLECPKRSKPQSAICIAKSNFCPLQFYLYVFKLS
jgi:hypothetical protein